MCKVAKLLPEPIKSLIYPSEDVNTDDTADKSLFGTTMQPITQSKAPTDKNTKRKRILLSSKPEASKNVRESPPKEQANDSHPAKEPVVTANITQSLGAFESTKEQGNQPKTVDAKKVQEIIIEKAEHVMEEEDHDMGTDSKISKEDIADNILNEMADLKAFADKPSDPLGHLWPEISSLSNKVDNLESSLVKKVSSKLEESVPRMVADAFKERMIKLLSDILKNILLNIIKESIQRALPKFDQMIQETMQSTVFELIHKPLNKELNALNTLETQRFASLQKELVTAIRSIVGKSVRKTLWKEMDIMKHRLFYC
ncbi:hypothetical protein Tco_1472347, partial [Tanacetum coccineum]